MKKLIFILTLFTSVASFAQKELTTTEYLCNGLNDGAEIVEATSNPKLIGKLGEKDVFLADDGLFITLTVKNKNVETSLTAQSGAILFSQKNGDNYQSLECAYAM